MAVSMDSIAKLPKSKKILILLAFVVVISGLYSYLLYLPQQEKLRRLKLDLGKLNKELKEGEAVKRDLAKFRKDDESLQRELTLALAQLPNKKEIPELLRNISSLGKGSGLEFLLFKPKPEERVVAQPTTPSRPKRAEKGKKKSVEPTGFYARVPLELTMLGGYHNVASFFDKISKLDRIINILNFSMGDVEQIGGETVVKTSCLATTFRFLETKGEGGAEKTKERDRK
ncbi:MAG: type 4a pilus biogenesis protein PilO [Syntrophobacterales bacterium]|nr:MAG: type 4a pilus biogenesis protein PilO [Syntrophobacterales bacterium]